MPSRYPQLVATLKEKSLKRGKFILASGRESTYYIDGKLTAFDPLGSALIVDAILEEIKDLRVDAVGGMDMGATPIVGALANRSHHAGRPLPTFVVRKSVKAHGTQKLVEGLVVRPGMKVVIVDDVVTTGDSIFKAIDAVVEQGCEVLLAISVLDRNAGAVEAMRQRGIEYRSLATLADLGIEDAVPTPAKA